jgi:hypothetical protein
MNLYIGSIPDEPDSIYLSVKAFKDKDATLFAAIFYWDTIYVKLSEEIPLQSLKYISRRATYVRVWFQECTEHILKLLIELYPALEGSLRKAYNTGGLDEVLSGVWWDRNED